MALPVLPALQAPPKEWAHYYAALGWPVFPCHGKLPLTPHGFKDASLETAVIEQWWTHWPTANIGSPAGLSWWALDVDPRAGGDSTLLDLEKQYSFLPHTTLSLTGGGGSHHLWAMPPAGISNKADLGDGLDVQGTGSYLVLPPSIHPVTGRQYCWDLVDNPEDLPPQPAPAWLLALVTTPPSAANGLGPSLTPGSTIPVGERDDTLMRAGVAMAHAGLNTDEIHAALAVLNTRCETPLSDADLTRLARSTSRYQRPVLLGPAPTPLPPPGWALNGATGQAPPLPPAPPQWRVHLAEKKTGGLIQDVRNMSLILEHADYFRGQLWWDDVCSRPMFGDTLIDDDTIVGFARWLGTEERMSVTNLRMLERCVLSRCRTLKHDVLRAWLEQLPAWDQTVRLDTWLHDYAGIEATVYGQEVSRLLILAMVARALDPGCLCRYVVILEGPEECGKSTLVQALASEAWYVVLSIGLDSKDSHMMLQGAWVAEMAELDSLSKTEETRLKAFITMRHDSYIPKYSNFRESHPRRAIFVGTTNEESYLKGQSGNTRFLPVKVTQQIDIDGFREVRDQLFAEALTIYRSGMAWWQMSAEGAEAALEERERRRLVNVYEHPLCQWLDYDRFKLSYVDSHGQPVRFIANETSWPELAEYFLKLKTPAEWKDKSLQMQIAQALKALGWERDTVWKQGTTAKIWAKTPF